MSPGLRRDLKNALRQLRGARHSLGLARSSATCPPWVLRLTIELAEAEERLLRGLAAEPEPSAREEAA